MHNALIKLCMSIKMNVLYQQKFILLSLPRLFDTVYNWGLPSHVMLARKLVHDEYVAMNYIVSSNYVT